MSISRLSFSKRTFAFPMPFHRLVNSFTVLLVLFLQMRAEALYQEQYRYGWSSRHTPFSNSYVLCFSSCVLFLVYGMHVVCVCVCKCPCVGVKRPEENIECSKCLWLRLAFSWELRRKLRPSLLHSRRSYPLSHSPALLFTSFLISSMVSPESQRG